MKIKSSKQVQGIRSQVNIIEYALPNQNPIIIFLQKTNFIGLLNSQIK